MDVRDSVDSVSIRGRDHCFFSPSATDERCDLGIPSNHLSDDDVGVVLGVARGEVGRAAVGIVEIVVVDVVVVLIDAAHGAGLVVAADKVVVVVVVACAVVKAILRERR